MSFPDNTWAKSVMVDAWVTHVQSCGKSGTWFDQLVSFLTQVGIDTGSHVHVTGVWMYDEGMVMDRLRQICHEVFAINPPTKVAYYYERFIKPLNLRPDAPWRLAPYLSVPAAASKLAYLARLRLRNHYLRVETSTWQESAPTWCATCGEGCVEDEQHLLFECSSYQHIRELCPPLFTHASISCLADLVRYDKKAADWAQVIRVCCKFLALTGRIYRS